MVVDPKIITTHALGGVGVGHKEPEYECPAHGNIGDSCMTVFMNTNIYKFEHRYCLVCYDEFLRGKRSTVNTVKEI